MRDAGIVVWLVALTAVSAAGKQLPSDWRLPTTSEIGQSWRQKSAQHYAVARADFDGDGVPDEALLVVGTSGSTAGVIVLWGRGKRRAVVVERFDDAAWLDVMGIDIAKPGEYQTACGKGYVECEADEPKTISLKRPGIDLFKEESANSFFVYDQKKGAFRRIWMSD